MSKTSTPREIVESLAPSTPPATVEEFREALFEAATLGKISGLRRARKLARQGRGVEASIKRAYVALGADTDEYERVQRERHPERYVGFVIVGTPSYEAVAGDSNALADSDFNPGVTLTVYDRDTLTVSDESQEASAFSNDVVAGFAGMSDLTIPSPRVVTDNPQA